MDTFGLIGLIRNRGVARALVNLIPSGYGAMTVDTDSDGVVDGFSHAHSHEASVLSVDGGQRLDLAGVTNADARVYVNLTSRFAASPNTAYALSVDAALVRSDAETLRLRIDWYTAGGVLISSSALSDIDPGTAYSRQQFTVTSPATAATANVAFFAYANTLGATGSAWFKDALFQAA